MDVIVDINENENDSYYDPETWISCKLQGVNKMKLTAYCFKLRKTVEIAEPELVTMKNGRKAVRGVAAEDHTQKVFRILGDSQVTEVEKQISEKSQ